MRALLDVRPAVADDLRVIAGLCITARQESATGAQLCIDDEDRLVRQLGTLASVPGGQIIVAHHEGAPVGFMLVRVLEPNLFNDVHSVYIEALYVAPDFRRRGAGHALLTAAGDLAASVGAPDVYSVPLPGSRGVQRFLARLGFAPAAGHRVVATAVLQRKLAAEAAGTRRQVRGIEDLIARRRKARIETHSGPVDLRSFQASLAQGTPPATEPPARTGSLPAQSLRGREHQAG
ncbi:GNAT family N-acetyltransferase [Sanguibacter suaedae]|uniref:GNAT family N-acetyltransferase n=1 Tax=Sanguibacter suaedae TaxID=2795737 RepID=A0A934IAJ9_9MICO|nr:GNAT family N-acetyltransferase [Sanguibacter suaedae]MBI9114922.1 GNAT family N-acetyltransferase [Sanguibacter suaedae]